MVPLRLRPPFTVRALGIHHWPWWEGPAPLEVDGVPRLHCGKAQGLWEWLASTTLHSRRRWWPNMVGLWRQRQRDLAAQTALALPGRGLAMAWAWWGVARGPVEKRL